MNLSDLRAFNLVYLAGPYRKYHTGLGMAYRDIERIAGRLFADHINVFSPIGHGHGMSVYGGIHPNANNMWFDLNVRFMRFCDALVVAKLDGWEQSDGTRDEIKFFESERKPIFYLTPKTYDLSEVA